MPYVQGEDRYQQVVFPSSIEEYVPEGSQVRVVDEFVNMLDLIKLGFQFAIVPLKGRPPYDPKDLIKLYLYGYLNRIRSSRRLEDETLRNVEVMWLLNRLTPDFKTIADFRKNNKKALKHVFREFNVICDEWDMFGKEMVAIDGSKFRASNSKRNNFSTKSIDRHKKYLNEKISLYMEELNKSDEAENEDKKHTPEEINHIIQELKRRNEEFESKQKQLEETGESEISTTDPDARRMNSNNNGNDVCYNVQTTVDSKHKLIVDFKVTNNPNDLGELDNMAFRVKKIFKVKSLVALADKGYYRAKDLKKCVDKGITPLVCKQTFSNGTGDRDFYQDKFKYDKISNTYTCPNKNELVYIRGKKSKGKIIGHIYKNFTGCTNCEYKSRCTKCDKGRTIIRHVDQDFLDTIDLQTQQNIETYKLRQMIVEHPFGTIKRTHGAYYFLTRRKPSVTTEIALSYLAYNFKRVINILGTTEILRRLKERIELATI